MMKSNIFTYNVGKDYWSGFYRTATEGQITLSDGHRELTDAEFASMASTSNPDRSSCPDCFCSFVDTDQKVTFTDCTTTTHRYLCVYEGQACPDGMVLLYGKCAGIVKNSVSSSGDDSNCRVKHENYNFQMYQFDNSKVELDILMAYLTSIKATSYLVMTGTEKSKSIGETRKAAKWQLNGLDERIFF